MSRLGRPGVVVVCVLLAIAVFAVFGQTLGHEFLNFDDPDYVYENVTVRQGLSREGIVTALTTVHSYTWHPLTTLSHILDWQLYGANASGHHATSVLIHAATSILLFLVLQQMTGAFWRSAMVAFLFAIHPLRVESVAWISERKDVLSGLFFVLTLGTYVWFTRGRASEARFPWGRYLIALAVFFLGLLAKPMLVTLPFVLLLLDYWPLNRTGQGESPLANLGQRVLEKLPFFGLAVACSLVTVLTQKGAMTSSEALTLVERLGNGLVSYVVYIRQLFLPFNLAFIYPHSGETPPLWEMGLAVFLLVGITVTVLVLRARFPFFLVGWFWYVGMLVPVSGLVQVGVQAHADRYTYLPHIGLYLMLVWGVAAWQPARSRGRKASTVLAALIVAFLMWMAWTYTTKWRDSESIWRHTIAHTIDNSVAHAQLGEALMNTGDLSEAVEHLRRAVAIQPDYATPRYNLGTIMAKSGDLEGAIEQFELALRAKPEYARAHSNLAAALLLQGRLEEAREHYELSLHYQPASPMALKGLGSVLVRQRKLDEGISHYREVLRLDPNNADTHGLLGVALGMQGRLDAGIGHLQRAAELDPESARAHGNLAIALEQQGDRPLALQHYRRALELAEASGDERLAGILRTRMQRYQQPSPGQN